MQQLNNISTGIICLPLWYVKHEYTRQINKMTLFSDVITCNFVGALTFQRDLLPLDLGYKNATVSSKILVCTYQTTQYHILKDHMLVITTLKPQISKQNYDILVTIDWKEE